MFTNEGTFKVRIDEVTFAEPKFATGPNDFDICIRVTALDDADQTDWWRGEVSENYGQGNFASQTQKEITLTRLRKLGFEGDDLTSVAEQLEGKETTATIKAREYNGRTFYDVKYLGGGGGNAPEPLAPDAVKARIAAMFGGETAAAAPAKAAPAATSKSSNPFAK
jgi:hypothetical protein